MTRGIAGLGLLFLLISGAAAAMGAMPAAARTSAAAAPASTQASGQAEAEEDFLTKAFEAIGPQERLTKIHAVRWIGNLVETTGEDKTSFEEERIQVYPDQAYLALKSDKGLTEKLVITPAFSYVYSGQMAHAVADPTLDAYRMQIRFDPIYVAQHAEAYSVVSRSAVKDGDTDVDSLEISSKGSECFWEIDAQTGRLLAIRYQTRSGTVIREYYDYRLVDGLYLPFRWETTESGRTTEVTIRKYEINPDIDASLFQPPNDFSAKALSFRVLQSETVEYAQQLGGEDSTNCQISRSEIVSTTASSLDDIAYLDGPIVSNLRMTCSSWDTTKFWPRKLNAMLVVASDNNAYIIACDKSWKGKWSKCAPLEAGEVFNGTHTDSGFAVHGIDTKGKEQEVDYSILQAEALP